jgi:HD-GYP domain-containing protein (c-di-GMP phosphodiesterase class II)
MGTKKQTLYPLQITISTLFIIITCIIGAVLSLQNYNKTSNIILSSADKLYAQIGQELVLDFKATYRPLSGTLLMLRQSPITLATTLEERLEYLKLFKTIHDSNTTIYSAGIGYSDGDLFATTLLDSQVKRDHFKSPNHAMLVALHIDTDRYGSRIKTSLFYDKNLQEISRQSIETSFDVHQRPWYQQATESPGSTKPYLFSEIKGVGMAAMIKTEQSGVVIGVNITLDGLTNKIAKYQLTPSSEVVLINAEGETYAYKNPEKVIIESGNNQLQLANLQQLDSDILKHIGNKFKPEEKNVDFEFNGQRWVGSSRLIGSPGGVDLFAVMVSPVDELLAEAAALRLQSLITTLVIILLSIPIIWFVSKKISNPLHNLAAETEKIASFEFDEPQRQHSFIKEVEELDSAMNIMRTTINKFIQLISSLSGEQDLDTLLKSVTRETKLISKADGALTYLLDETDNLMKPGILFNENNEPVETEPLPELNSKETSEILEKDTAYASQIIHLDNTSTDRLSPLLKLMNADTLSILAIPLTNRNNEVIGMLLLIYKRNKAVRNDTNRARIAFVEALSGFAAVTLESRQMLNMQEALLNSFIKLIAGAIDEKSPYTGGHCQRVPEITALLAKAACDSDDPKFKDFDLDDKQWQALEIACWLHDCGKVTTPEYIVDKATKLETIYDRIHEIRMRFEVLKRDAEINFWQQLSEGVDEASLKKALDEELQALDDDYAFIAECNEGGEFMADEKIERLNKIAERTWTRTLDDRIGISWEELNRKNRTNKSELPVEEKLLSDKTEHIIERSDNERIPDDNPWNFKLDTPEYKYNRGELYNLGIKSGTLSEEERFKINEHMVQTIVMLTKLPYPKHLKDVPDIAGCHHETLDGKGYPKRLTKEQTPITGRMMTIADIFEALTASDRPYKKAKKLSEAIKILSFMKKDNHIDPDLFELFLTSGAYLEYANNFLDPEQIDEIDISEYVSS